MAEIAPTIEIAGGGLTKQPAKKRNRRSNWLITINTNQQFPDLKVPPNRNDEVGLEELAEHNPHFGELYGRLMGCVEEFSNNLRAYIKWNEAGVDRFLASKFAQLEVRAAPEVGGKNNQLHAHIVVLTQHSTNIQLNFPAVKAMVLERMGLPNVYVSYKWDGKADPISNWSNYVLKNVATIMK